MKVCKLILAILFMMGATNSIVAQSQVKDSSGIYNYWAHRGIIETVYAYMKDYSAHSEIDALQVLELQGMLLYEKEFILNIKEEGLTDLDAVSNFLQGNHWVKTEENIFQPLHQRFKDGRPLDSNFFDGIIDKKDYLIWKQATKNIVEKYQSQLADLEIVGIEASKQEAVEQGPLNERYQQNYPSKEINSNWTGPLFTFLIFIAGLLIGGWIVFLISKRKIYSILEYEKSEYSNKLDEEIESFTFKYIGLVNILKNRKDWYKENSKRVENALNEKSKDLESVRKEVTNQKFQNKHTQDQNLQSSVEQNFKEKESGGSASTPNLKIKPQEKQKTKLFFSMPDGDGRFNNHNAKSVNDGKNFYRIEFMESADNGNLFFLPSEKDKRAIHRLESFLKPVCDIEDLSNAESASRIELISPGMVNLINDSWVIDPENKVQIKLV